MGRRKQTHCSQGHELSEENIRMNGIKRRCKTCDINYRESHKEEQYQRTRKWAIEHPERMREFWRKHDRAHQKEKTIYMRNYGPSYRLELKKEALTHYGNGKLECICCGESHIIFLTLDHVYGRKNTKDNGRRAWMLLQWLRSHGYPRGYQTLCWNCNSGRQLNKGICPHKQEQTITEANVTSQ